MDTIRAKHKEMIQLIEDINRVTEQFNGSVFFMPPSLKVSFNNFEVCFTDYIFYLFSLFVELPGANLKFVDAKIKAFGIPLDENAAKVSRLALDLRTIKGHVTSIEKPSDRDKIYACEDWFTKICGDKEPQNGEDFGKCTRALLDDTIAYLKTVLVCIREFNKVEFPDIIKVEWERQIRRNFTKYQWQVELLTTLELYGMDHYDTKEIVDKQYDNWSGQLKLLKDGFVFSEQARIIIQRYLDKQDLWPASAEDIHALGIPKGPGMAEMVRKAKAIYYNSPCSKTELLKKFKEQVLDQLENENEQTSFIDGNIVAGKTE